jgi:hypothetical protein
MREAVEAIDKQFGDGYAREHPELVAGFMQAAAIDQAGMYIRSLVETLDLWPVLCHKAQTEPVNIKRPAF